MSRANPPQRLEEGLNGRVQRDLAKIRETLRRNPRLMDTDDTGPLDILLGLRDDTIELRIWLKQDHLKRQAEAQAQTGFFVRIVAAYTATYKTVRAPTSTSSSFGPLTSSFKPYTSPT